MHGSEAIAAGVWEEVAKLGSDGQLVGIVSHPSPVVAERPIVLVLNAGVPSQPFLFLSTQVAKTTLVRTGPGIVPGTQAYQAAAKVVDETGAPLLDGAMVSGTLVEWDAAACAFTPGLTPPGTCSTELST